MLETQARDVRCFGFAAQGVEHFVWESARGWRVNVCFSIVFLCIVYLISLFLCPPVVPPCLFARANMKMSLVRLICCCLITYIVQYS